MTGQRLMGSGLPCIEGGHITQIDTPRCAAHWSFVLITFATEMGAGSSNMGGAGASTVLATEETLNRLGRFVGATQLPYADKFW